MLVQNDQRTLQINTHHSTLDFDQQFGNEENLCKNGSEKSVKISKG